MSLLPSQVKQLLAPIKPTRVLVANGHKHVSQQDVVAHLIRVFGFGSFDVEVLQSECVFETALPIENAASMTDKAIHKALRYDICYRALVRLTVRCPDGSVLARYENGSTGMAQNQTRGDGHDLAYKAAISLSVKRCAIFLGDQFGLSLYNRGQMEALVMGTLIMPDGDQEPPGDMQEGVPQQVSLGNDETEPPPVEPDTEPEPPAPAPETPAAEPAAEPEPDPVLDAYRDLNAKAEKNGNWERVKAHLLLDGKVATTPAEAIAAYRAMTATKRKTLWTLANAKD